MKTVNEENINTCMGIQPQPEAEISKNFSATNSG
jgi:hypothetical protein